jgi:Ser/Thr protein kinase RdoA (MazF antagonist)
MKGDAAMEELLGWCASVLGPVKVVSDQSRDHPGKRASACRLRTPSDDYYVKLHRDLAHWNQEAHGYEQWAPAFGEFAPRLVAVRDEAPLAVLVSALPGMILEGVQLTTSREQAVWRAAGQALVALHELAVGTYFGPCQHDGVPAGTPIYEAREYISTELDNWVERGLRAGCLSADELAIVRAARDLIPAFAGERPTPCHRDYCPANWLVTADGAWAGVIDFEFAYWDVRAADFIRYPSWEWVDRPDLVEAFFDGYGRSFTTEEEQQYLVAQVQYALGALVWGRESAYHGFAAEGQRALKHLGALL